MCDNKLEDVGLSLSSGNERSCKQRIYQHHTSYQQTLALVSNTGCLLYGTNCCHVSPLLYRLSHLKVCFTSICCVLHWQPGLTMREQLCILFYILTFSSFLFISVIMDVFLTYVKFFMFQSFY